MDPSHARSAPMSLFHMGTVARNESADVPSAQQITRTRPIGRLWEPTVPAERMQR